MAKKTLRAIAKPVTRISVTIEEANNGFMVSSWIKEKNVRYIAKDIKEAMGYASKIFAKF